MVWNGYDAAEYKNSRVRPSSEASAEELRSLPLFRNHLPSW